MRFAMRPVTRAKSVASLALAAAALSTIGGVAAIESPAPLNSVAPTAEQKTLEQFGRDTQACGEWSDGCAVCVRHGDGSTCSLPGIACQPSPPACRDR